jgi:hypothetical protein
MPREELIARRVKSNDVANGQTVYASLASAF